MTQNTCSAREEFDKLFEELTGAHPDNAPRNIDGWLFVSTRTGFVRNPEEDHFLLVDLTGHPFENSVVVDQNGEWWIRRPD